MKPEQKSRLCKVAKTFLQVLAIGFLYYCFVKLTGLAIPCIFHVITDKYCPGCGLTRMIFALSEGNFKAALKYNALLLFMLPILFAVLIKNTVQFVKNGKTQSSKTENILIIFCFIASVCFTIMRNTERFDFLRP